jgi:hypothetical protein
MDNGQWTMDNGQWTMDNKLDCLFIEKAAWGYNNPSIFFAS